MILIAGYVIDAALSEEHTNEADVSDFPVEDGSNFTDNVRIKPRRYRMEGIVSDTPLDLGFRRLQDDGSTIVTSISTTPSSDAKQALEALFLTAKPITIVTALDTYNHMVMQSLSFKQDAETGDALPFSAAFIQINVVQNVRRLVKIKFTAMDRGNLATHPPGWIGTDKQGRDIVVDPSSKGPGLQPKYVRADGTAVASDEAAEATRRQGAVLVKYDKDGNAIPIAQQDYQPFSPRQKTSWWSPQAPIPSGVPIQ